MVYWLDEWLGDEEENDLREKNRMNNLMEKQKGLKKYRIEVN